MTLIIGILCQDGIVVGSDGAATYATTLGQNRTIIQPTTKLKIVGDQVILGVSGPIGLGQSYDAEIESKVRGTQNQVTWKTIEQAKDSLQECFWKHAKIAWERAELAAKTVGPGAALGDALHQTVVALPIADRPYLVQFNEKCHPEEASRDLPFLSVGSGQPTADPFLAFLRRTLWRDALPSLQDGILATLWTLEYAIKATPGGIAEPIQIAVLRKENDGKWRAKILSEDTIGQDREMVKALEDELAALTKRLFTAPPKEPIP